MTQLVSVSIPEVGCAWLSKGQDVEMAVPGGRVRFTFRDTSESGTIFAALRFEPVRSGLMRFGRPAPDR
jgi:hypothetical protein